MLSPHYRFAWVVLLAVHGLVLRLGFHTASLDLKSSVYLWALVGFYLTSLVLLWWPTSKVGLASWRIAFACCAGLFCWRFIALYLQFGDHHDSLIQAFLVTCWQVWPICAVRRLIAPAVSRESKVRSDGASLWRSLWTALGAPSMGCVTPLWLGLASLVPLGMLLYCNLVFRFHHLEDPPEGLSIVRKDDPAEVAFFRKKTVTDIIEPTLLRLESLRELQEQSEGGTKMPFAYARMSQQLSLDLPSLMNVAKLRQIPKQYEDDYSDVLEGISEIDLSLKMLRFALRTSEPEEKSRALNESVRLAKMAQWKLARARRSFNGT